MKKSRFVQIVREEIQSVLKEYGQELLYFQPSGFEQIDKHAQINTRHYSNFEEWKVTAMQKGAVVHDRGEDYVAILPSQDKIGVFSKGSKMGTLTY
jgi:hypothetical protein